MFNVVPDEKHDTRPLDRNRPLVYESRIVGPEEIPYGCKVMSIVIDVTAAVRLNN